MNTNTNPNTQNYPRQTPPPLPPMTTKLCKHCKQPIAQNAKVCPYCRKKQGKPVALIVIICVVVLIIIGAAAGGGDDEETNTDGTEQKSLGSNEQKTDSDEMGNDQTDAEINNSPVVVTDFNTDGYFFIDADVLYEYGKFLADEKVVTVIEVAAVTSDMLKARTDNNLSLFYSVNCGFPGEYDLTAVSDGDLITVAGTVSKNTTSTVVLNDCTIIGLGEIADELKSKMEEQKNICEGLVKESEEAVESQAAADKDSFISGCKEVNYEDVARNPDNYKDKQIIVKGEVIQVQEGFFNSFTMRVSDDNGDIWYVTYKREEGQSRILEGDKITLYGVCGGVESYTSVLGSKITIPSVKMKYYDIDA